MSVGIHAGDGNNDTDDDEGMIDESIPYAATGLGFYVLGANPDLSLLRTGRNLTLTLRCHPTYKKTKKSDRIWRASRPLSLERDQRREESPVYMSSSSTSNERTE